MVKQALKISGVTSVALTKLDVLDTFPNLKICTSYKIQNSVFNYLPSDNKSQNLVEPIYEEIQGWEVSTKNIDKFDKLPENAISYIKRLEELIECPIKIISTSPDRKDTIILENLFN